MKKVKTTVAMAMAVLGMASMNAMAGETVHWGDSDSGTTKAVKWQAFHPGHIEFVLSPADLSSFGPNGEANGAKNMAGHWANRSGAVNIKADSYSSDNTLIAAKGDQSGEILYWTLVWGDGTPVIATFDPTHGSKIPRFTWDKPARGNIDAKVTDSMGRPITDITKVKSGTFTSRVTIDLWQD